ncbi:ABC transporter substrate-binding protein [Kibdelosporangium lantanae]|uniref:ABC transporter substrate-binding protein n=1 Tax=Kibdelosporangium lantanae TaxID=1497396 RepID=A0ABW3M511_9PSEU
MWKLRRRKDIDRRLAKLRDTVYDAPSVNDDPAYREQFLDDLFSGLSLAGRSSSVKVTRKRALVTTLPVNPWDDDQNPGTPPPSDKNGHSGQPTRRRIRNRRLMIASITVIAILGAGVALLASTQNDSSQAQGVPGFRIRVGYLPVVDVAPFYQALDKGYFTDEGLAIDHAETISGPFAVESLVQGNLDIAFSSDPGFFTAEIRSPGAVKVINTAYTAKGLHLVLLSGKDSSFRSLNQAAGKKIAVTSTESISDLGLVALGVPRDAVHWVPMNFTDMVQALVRGDVDGAVVAEPFVTILMQKYHAHLITGIIQGDTDDFPMSAWGVNAEFARRYPDKVAAFQRALARGAVDVRDPHVRDLVMSAHTPGLTPDIAPAVARGTYPTGVDEAELQRAANLTTDKHIIPRPLDVGALILRLPQGQN